MCRFVCVVSVLMILPLSVDAAEIIQPANQRFQNATGDDTPSFQRHVVPLLGRLGCNGRACHGSFQGQGGFRLSLFGYDFKADHEALLGGEAPRANVKSPIDSLMLQKPTKTIAHRGGKRMEVNGWEYNLILRWLKAGAPAVQETDAVFVS